MSCCQKVRHKGPARRLGWKKALEAKPEDLGWIPGTHTVGRGEPTPLVVV